MQKVSVIIPGYNMAEFSVKAVESVLNQTYKNIELIFVDDGSTDNTREKIAPYTGRLRYISKANGGACSARNLGIRESTGEIIAMLDCDDMYLPQKIEECVNFLQEHPDHGLVHTDAYVVDEHDHVIGMDRHRERNCSGWITDKLNMTNFICNPTVVFRKKCLEKTGGYDETLFPPADWDLWLRISEHYEIGYISSPLSQYRMIANSCFQRLEQVRRENKIVLDRFFQRNPNMSVWIKHQAYARHHLSMAQCYFLKGDHERLKEEFSLSLKEHPFNPRAGVLFLGFFLARDFLRSHLNRKILRTAGQLS